MTNKPKRSTVQAEGNLNFKRTLYLGSVTILMPLFAFDRLLSIWGGQESILSLKLAATMLIVTFCYMTVLIYVKWLQKIHKQDAKKAKMLEKVKLNKVNSKGQ